MKKISIIMLLTGFAFLFTNCGDDQEDDPSNSVVVLSNFGVDVPNTLTSNGIARTSATVDPLEIDASESIYEPIRSYITIGEFSAELVEEIMTAIGTFGLDAAASFEYVSDDDGRAKSGVVSENVVRDGVSWDFELLISDVGDNAKAMQVLWNNSPVKGLAVISPYNLDHTTDGGVAVSTMRYKVEYDENPGNKYDAEMLVQITNMPPDPSDDGAPDNFKMYVGKLGDVVDVYGNSNHPTLKLDEDPNSVITPRNYAFVARGDEIADVGVVKAAMPISSETSTANIFTNYDIKTIFKEELGKEFGQAAADTYIDDHLINYELPAYFNAQGFIASGIVNKPTSFSSDFADISDLTPFVPKDIRDLVVDFAQ